MESNNSVVISSESEVFEWLQKALSGNLGENLTGVSFRGWPVVEIRLDGPGYESTVTPEMARALMQYQHALNRAYARVVHGAATSRILTTSEKNQLRLKARVEDGSSLIKIDFGEQFAAFANKVIGKMSPDKLTVLILGLAAITAGTLSYKWYLDKQSENKKVEESERARIAMSSEETKRLELVLQTFDKGLGLRAAKEDFDDARHEVLKGVADAKSLSVNGLKISGETARAIAASRRETSREVQLNGNYQILEVHWNNDGEVKLRLIDYDTRREFFATLRDGTLDQVQVDLVKQAEWARSKVYMSINAHELRGEITKATVVSVALQPPEK